MQLARIWIGLVSAVMLNAASLSAHADQTAEELPSLFDTLSLAQSIAETKQVEADIWGHWLTGPDKAADQMMAQIQVAMQSGRYELGLLLCNQVVDAYPNFAEGWNKRATLYYLMNRFDESVTDIQATLELEPRHFGALSGLGLILMESGDAEGALQAFEEVLAISPNSMSAKANAARARDQIGTEI